LKEEIRRLATFLGKSLTDEQLKELTQHLRFDSFSKNEAVNNEIAKEIGFMNPEGHFIRKGKLRLHTDNLMKDK
jgi:Sulfotransferase domain